MKKNDLITPSVLINEAALLRNIRRYQALCDQHGKKLWPMVKTHKCTAITKMQQVAGADGFLCGTLHECETLANAGVTHLMYAYPVANEPNLSRVTNLAKQCNFYVRLDHINNAKPLHEAALRAGVCVNYTMIIDSGLHRLGIAPHEAGALASQLKGLKGLCFKGISTHPGHVYAAKNRQAISLYVKEEGDAIATAVKALKENGFTPSFISSGSTPTFAASLQDRHIQIYHPGNYVFNDLMQLALGTANAEDCAMTVLASVIARPRDDLLIMDAGSKTLGLDAGAHGNTAIQGFGKIVNHPNLVITSLSEEVGKINLHGSTTLKIGDKIEILPNHACVPANLTSRLWLCDKDRITGSLDVDMRNNIFNPE